VRVAISCRVSTTRQAQQQTIEQQRERLIARAHEQGWALHEGHVFRDEGYSGSVLARPGLDHLRDAARNRELDRIIVTAPDRLARNYVQQMVLLEEFAHAGCPVDFLDRPMSDDPHDQLLLQIRGAVAEYERTLIAERMRRGRLSTLRAGLLLPWTRPPYGYRLAPERPRDPTGVTLAPDEAAVVAEVFARYLEPTMSLAQRAKALQRRAIPTPSGKQRWSGPTIRGILGNPTYTGQVYAQRTRYREPQIRRSATHARGRPHGTATPQPPDTWIAVGAVPAIVTQARFDRVQAKLAQNRSFSPRNNGIVTPNGNARWNSATVRGILTNPSYTGQVYAGRSQARVPRGRHSALRPTGRPSTTQVPLPREEWIAVAAISALISPAQFEQVQAKLAQNQQFARRNNTARDYLLRALPDGLHRAERPQAALRLLRVSGQGTRRGVPPGGALPRPLHPRAIAR